MVEGERKKKMNFYRKFITRCKNSYDYTYWVFSGKAEELLPTGWECPHYFGIWYWKDPVDTALSDHKQSHTLGHDLTVTYLREGRLAVEQQGKKYILEKGDLFSPSLEGDIEMFPLAPGTTLEVLGYFDSRRAREAFLLAVPPGKYHFHLPQGKSLAESFARIKESLEEKSPWSFSRICAEGTLLLLEIYRQSGGRKIILSLDRLGRKIAVSPGEPYTLENLASSAGMGRQTFLRKFRKKFGVSPMQYVKNARVALAAFHLQQEEYDLENIAELCGWRDVNSFITSFRKAKGLPPVQYRKNFLYGDGEKADPETPSLRTKPLA